MERYVRVEREGPLLIVTLDRVEKHNAFHPSVHQQLEEIWNEYFADAALRVAILTGAGDKAFCAGSDLSGYASPQQAAVKLAMPQHGYAGLTHRFGTTKPIIAAVNGLALGGGFEVMLCCDLAVASSNAEFGLPEPLVGAAALGGGIPRLCRKLPYTIAMTLLLTGDRLSAADALRFGLISELVEPGQALHAAKRLAQRILRGAPLAIAATKQIADATLNGDDIETVLRFEDGAPAATVMGSEDLREGVAAFFGKRSPQWRGR